MTFSDPPDLPNNSLARTEASPVTPAELADGLESIARATDALVKRVSEGGLRDKSELLLDQSRQSYREESRDGLQRNVRCDRCALKSPGAATQERANAIAESIGWIVSDAFDHCPTCRDDAPKLLGEGDALPRELSIPDQIFVTRLEWIIERIASGATPYATLLNARRSGHRSMLTDLARSFSYEVEPFVAKITSSIALQLPGIALAWQRAPTVGGDEWVFLEKLFKLLKDEDGA